MISLHSKSFLPRLMPLFFRTRDDGEAPWRQVVRILSSVLVCWIIGELIGFSETVWALITSLIVTQASITQTLSTARDQIIGTLIGAVAGTLAITARIYGAPYWPVFAITLIPLAMIAAIRPSMRFAGVTLMIVYLLPSHGNPYWPLTTRLSAIFLGVIVALTVSYFILRQSARRRAFITAAKIFRELNTLIKAALSHQDTWQGLEKRYEICGRYLVILNDCLDEAERENLGRIERQHPILPLLPELMRRMMSDTMLVARAINAGKNRAGTLDTVALSQSLSHCYRALARKCELHATRSSNTHAFSASKDDITQGLPSVESHAAPEMHFVFALLRQNLRSAANLLTRHDT